VAEGKSNGLIVDYIGVVKALRKALADYTRDPSDGPGGDPVFDKEELLAQSGCTALSSASASSGSLRALRVASSLLPLWQTLLVSKFLNKTRSAVVYLR
jgi:hypothetical protein